MCGLGEVSVTLCLRLCRIQLESCFPTCTNKMGKDKMQRGGSINPASFLQKPQFNVHDPSLSCFMVVNAVGICHTMSKKKKRSDCSRTQTCSWNLCVNSWKYCWLLSRTKAWDMVDLIFIYSLKPLFVLCWGWTAWNSFAICFDIRDLIFPYSHCTSFTSSAKLWGE